MQVRLMSWNVQGLSQRPDRQKALGDTLREVDADVVSLQEVPSKAGLDSMLKQEGLAETYPHRRFFKTNDEQGENHLAVLSKHPIAESRSNKDKNFKVDGAHRPFQFTRDVAEVKIELGGYPLRVYNTHLKANPQIPRHDPDFARKKAFTDAIRHGEGRAFKDIIKTNLKRSPSEHFAITMDANAVPTDPVVRSLTQGFAAAHDPLANQPEAHSHPSSRRRLDYVLVSEGLAQKYVDAQVVDTPKTRLASDHNPTVLTMDLG
jgi:endonuclease/exonuclease/phosphatase family metal-dependent hydrolase